MYTTLQSIRESGGFQFKVEGSPLTGTCNGSNKTFYVPSSDKPLVDTNYSDTVTTADIVVYDDGVAVAVTSVNSSTGEIVLTAAPASSSIMTIDYSWSNLSDGYISEWRSKADSEIDGYLADRYARPLAEVPDLISSLSTELSASMIIMSNYALSGGRGDEGLKRAKEARATLLRISKGEIKLISSTGAILANTEVTSPSTSVSSSDTNTELFTLNDENFTLGKTNATDVGDDW